MPGPGGPGGGPGGGRGGMGGPGGGMGGPRGGMGGPRGGMGGPRGGWGGPPPRRRGCCSGCLYTVLIGVGVTAGLIAAVLTLI